jgi:hypothetical protein
MKGFEWMNFARVRIISWFIAGFIIGFGIMYMVLKLIGR